MNAVVTKYLKEIIILIFGVGVIYGQFRELSTMEERLIKKIEILENRLTKKIKIINENTDEIIKLRVDNAVLKEKLKQ